jgi:CheY-like chemotaxis protein
MKTETNIPESKLMQQLFARAGLPHQVTVSAKLRQAYQMPADMSQPEWVELAWIVNLILNRCVPAVEMDTPHGHVRIAEFCSVPVGRGDTGERTIAVAQPKPDTLHIALPEEVRPAAGKVLLVDDDAQLREVTSLIFQAAGIPHECAAGGLEAWEKIQACAPLAVVTDVEMPGLSGLELCRRIKAGAQTSSTPVIVMSGKPEYAARAEAAGAVEFFPKPLDIQRLVKRLKQFIG